MIRTAADVTAADVTAIFYLFNHSIPDLRQLVMTSLLPLYMQSSAGGGTGAPEHEGAASHMAMEGHTADSESTSGTEGEGSFTAVTGSATSDTDSSSDGSSLVVAATSMLSTSTAVTPPKVVKGQKKSPKSGKNSTAEKAAILPAAQDATASPIVTGPETTARVSAQEGRTIVTGLESTARVSAQEGSTIITGPETTARVSAEEGSAATAPLGNEGPPCHTPLHRSETAKSSTAEQGKHR
ncbi:hypothetical protein NDU88_003784 [Pleurodeles waltl]|uniref:Uncharacterized protein n=1 Tax=Pleurodeles waltl TaxID=8319 RepID=A0AAV7WSM3_PLEWA|nr:hypothetical protein NDU88_003784 [Pleurodeles waltl]